ncbi:hypothetical protein FACS189459_5010 [Bacilli bacterium]|nr:hypothetical protein FACS189459_5010 [Bacilli bacterium]
MNPNKFGSGAKGILIFIPVIIVLFAAFYGLGYSIARFKNFLHSNNSIVN